MISAIFRNAQDVRIARIPIGPPPATVRLDDVYLVLSTLTNTPVSNFKDQYNIRVTATGETLPAGCQAITAGKYQVLPKADAVDLTEAAPGAGLFPPRSSSKPGSRTPSRSGSSESLTLETTAAAEVKRYARFTMSLALRDRRCIVTGKMDPYILVGAHIIPHTWKNREYIGLPPHIRDALDDRGVDHISNGALMEGGIHTSFDFQHWSVVEEGDGKWRIIRITPSAPEEIIGKYLITPDAGGPSDGMSYPDLFIDPIFLRFHFRTAVFRHMQAAGDDDDHPFDDGEDKLMKDVIKVWGNDQRFNLFVESGGNIAEATE
ncbi:uncharacterized protein EV422DRAFT_522094 [Fimicolochytrium jonesii]|uniref:uncharacterized protein n=1 Tax=Fimicolochytrium jonesii TaxID=1396493 RepID=UPI0022FE1C76|nr:uncharacterized protein EV422DRAFT_522094 [Fimicolochytrium jonesii]KAI8823725.1 hypothetical protein EV422DRAFT_522094 [Fimicolochytrium jonesii]